MSMLMLMLMLIIIINRILKFEGPAVPTWYRPRGAGASPAKLRLLVGWLDDKLSLSSCKLSL
jgi:hypothetical protein